ncbi:Bgt-50354 [Blumeria graminis f. sp. tritici]|uniref:Bgt-50354 n=1 Tax=Blumeria graminis f. sp. tritici TaxID=62690 RepID=A0A9X9L9H5_BLUGR|nr:Bgt-50354 [Blumeria graminis f. sp. tritici]
MSSLIESSRRMDELIAITGTMKYMALELLWNICENKFTLRRTIGVIWNRFSTS